MALLSDILSMFGSGAASNAGDVVQYQKKFRAWQMEAPDERSGVQFQDWLNANGIRLNTNTYQNPG